MRHASAYIGVDKFFSKNQGSTTTHVLSSEVFVSRRVPDLDSLANRLARVILDRDPAAAKEDVIAISIFYDYDIGIASAWRSQNFAFSPEQWRKRFSPL